MSLPVVGLSCDVKVIAPHPYHCVGDKYARAVMSAAEATPVLLPSLGVEVDVERWLSIVDGLVFTGSYANIHPRNYGREQPFAESPLDADRDATTLPLIRAAIDAGVPVFGLCRGFQEMNVAFGGSLYQKVHDEPGFMNHLEDSTQPVERQYAVAHRVTIEADGLLATLSEQRDVEVNSLHGQGVRRLAPGLKVEARAPDGLVEAFSVTAASAFALGVQWHPEWRPEEHPYYRELWRAFGDACRQRARMKRGVARGASNRRYG